MKIAKTKLVKKPLVSDDGSSGYDFYTPMFSEKFINHFYELNSKESAIINNYEDTIEIYPHEVVKIPTGIKIKMKRFSFLSKIFNFFTGLKIIPKFQAYDKSSIGSKGLTFLAGLVDWSYRGEIIVVMVNTTDKKISIAENKKFIQFTQEWSFVDTKITELPESDFDKNYNNTNRGNNGFGSTS